MVDLSASDTIPPVLEVVAPPAGPIRDVTPQLILGFSDQGFGVESATLSVRLDGVALSGCVTYPGWAVCSTPTLDPGVHTIDASVADRAGNAATANRTFTVDPGAADPTPPELRIAAPNSGTVGRLDPQIVLAYRDDESGLDPDSLEVELDGVDLTSDCTAENSRASCPTSGLAIGPHRIEARIANGAGAESTAAFEFTVVVETDLPYLERIAPPNLLVTTETPTLAYFYEDLISGIDFATFALRVGGVPAAGCDVGPFIGGCEVGPLTAGVHTIEVEVSDQVGNVGTLSETLTVELQPEDTVDPQMTILAPAEGAVIRGASVAVQVTFEDSLSGVVTETLRIDVDGVDIDLAQCNIGGGQALCSADGLAAGQHTLGAEIRDRSGNLGSATGAFVTVLQAAVSITSPATGFVTSAEAVDVEGVFEGTIESITVAGRPALVGDGNFVVADVPLHEGGNTLTAVARGGDGTIGTATVQVVRDSEAPKVVIRSPVEGFVSSASQIAVTGELISPSSSSTEGRPVRVWVNGQEADVESGTFALADLRLTPGLNRIEVEAEDAAGNRDTSSVAVRVAPVSLARLEPIGDARRGRPGGRAARHLAGGACRRWGGSAARRPHPALRSDSGRWSGSELSGRGPPPGSGERLERHRRSRFPDRQPCRSRQSRSHGQRRRIHRRGDLLRVRRGCAASAYRGGGRLAAHRDPGGSRGLAVARSAAGAGLRRARQSEPWRLCDLSVWSTVAAACAPPRVWGVLRVPKSSSQRMWKAEQLPSGPWAPEERSTAT